MFNIIQGQAHLIPLSKTASPLNRVPKTMFISLSTNKWEGMDEEEEAVSFSRGKRFKEFCHSTWLGACESQCPKSSRTRNGRGRWFHPTDLQQELSVGFRK